MRAAVASALASCTIAGVAACSIYGTDLLLPAAPDGGHDGLDATADDVSAPDSDTCGHARWPDRPAADDPSSAPDVEVIAAIATLDIGVQSDGGVPPTGFDLDGVCTCPGPGSCVNASATKPQCDNAGGGDNAGGALLSGLGAFGSFNSLALNDRLHRGLFGLVVVVRNWNGQPNDRAVTVAVYVSNGLSGVEDGGAFGPVKGDGTDRWTVDPSSTLGGAGTVGRNCDGDNPQCAPAYFDSNAYVAGGQLVGALDFPIAIGGLTDQGTVVFDLRGSVVTARLTHVDAGWSLTSGVLAGRWASDKLLSSLAAIADPLTSGSFLCGDDGTYRALKRQICAMADITDDPMLGGTGARCDALSIAVTFTALPAHLGEVYDKGPSPAGCADGGAPFHDQCP